MFPCELNQGIELSDYSLGPQLKNSFQFSYCLCYEIAIWDRIEMRGGFLSV